MDSVNKKCFAPDVKMVRPKNVANDLKINLALSHSLLLQNSLDESVSNPFDLEHLDTKRYGNTGFESQPKSNAAIQLATLLRGKKGDQDGAPKRKLKNLLLRTRKLDWKLASKENIKKWSSKSNPSRLAWLLRLKKGKQEFLVKREN